MVLDWVVNLKVANEKCKERTLKTHYTLLDSVLYSPALLGVQKALVDVKIENGDIELLVNKNQSKDVGYY